MKRWNEVLSVTKRRSAVRGRRRGPEGTAGGGMYLASLRRTVPADPNLLTPGMRVAMVEDLWWSIQMQVWTAAKPPLWQRGARALWRVQGQELAEKQQRIRALAGS